ARGRDMAPEEVDRIGQGRIWTGRKALELGLVDALGQLPDAVAAAAQRAGLTEYEVRFIERPLTAREQLLQQITDSLGFASDAKWSAPWTRLAREFADLMHIGEGPHTYALCDDCNLNL
ncbi:MAG TPA: S49 family peptidase, partial [Pseudomonadales bacterium]